MKKEGEQGRRKMNQYTRYGTVALATLQAYGLAVSLYSGELVKRNYRIGSSSQPAL
jgi:preprotein translocase subunit SecY